MFHWKIQIRGRFFGKFVGTSRAAGEQLFGVSLAQITRFGAGPITGQSQVSLHY